MVLSKSSLLGGNLNSSASLIPSYIKSTVSQGPRLEDRRPSRRPSRDPLPLSKLSMVPNQVIGELVLDGGGNFSPAGIVGVHSLSLLLSFQAAHDRAAGNTRETHNRGH